MNKIAKLVLENGTVFSGTTFGSDGETIGEVCFNTGMTGYQEILTDPSYCGQLVTMTYPHIGNYGVNTQDAESTKIQAAGFIIREESVVPSHFRSMESVGDYLRRENVVGIQNIDTRMLTRIIRNEGAMNGIISTIDLNKKSLQKKVKAAQSMDGMDLVKAVTCKENYLWESPEKSNYKIAVIDFGIKHNILRILKSHGCNIMVFSAKTNADEILNFNPDGVFLSNGPGDPAAVTYGIETVKKLLGKKPLFGICLGHQILALALGAKTYKMKFGHRGCNHPVINLSTNAIEITSQNHGFSVDPYSLPENVQVTHTSLNDQTVEGLSCKNIPAFSVQYHPESSPGPHDSRYLFTDFINMISQKKLLTVIK